VISFETSVRIERPIEQVFAFVSDPIQFPQWNSAVQAVRRTSVVRGASAGTGEPGSTYSIERELPSGRVENGLEVFVLEQPTEFGIRTTSGPTPFVYDYAFAPDGQDTIIHLDASVELVGVTAALGPLAARAIRRGVDANFTALKRTLEGDARTTRRVVEGRSGRA
jgi:carbon monoxide dehydrogenase subunit G